MRNTPIGPPDETSSEIMVIAEREKRMWSLTKVALEQAAQGEVVNGEDVVAWVKSWNTAAVKPTPKQTKEMSHR